MATSPPFSPSVVTPAEGPQLDLALSRACGQAPVFIALFEDPGGRLAYLNVKARQTLNPGNNVDWAARGCVLSELIGPASRDVFNSVVSAHLGVLGQWEGWLDLLNVTGNVARVFAVLRRLKVAGGRHYVCLHALDSGGPSEGSRAVARDQDYLNALLNHLPDWVYFKDRAGRFLLASNSLTAHLELDDQRELIGRTNFDFFPVEQAAEIHGIEQGILGTGRGVCDLEEKQTLPDGRVIHMSTTRLPLYDAGGEMVGTFGLSHDITAKKRAESERRELELQLQLSHKLEAIGMLAAGIAHEINTPTQFITDNTRYLREAFGALTATLDRYRALVAGNAELSAAARDIEERAELSYHLEEVPKTLDQTLEGLGRVARIVGSLKEFSHPHTLERKPADLNKAIETTISVARHEWKYVADVVTEFDETLPPVPCILDEFNQVVLNLVVNACHAIAEMLKAAGKTKGKGVITIRTRHDANAAWMEVSDTGTGIPEEIRGRIFELFFTTKRAGLGTGQGLALVRTIVVQHHGGSVDFTSEVGKGTTFRVQLPLVVSADAVRPPLIPPSP